MMMPRRLIVMTSCGGVVLRAPKRSAHVLSFAMPAMRVTGSQAPFKLGRWPFKLGGGGNYSDPSLNAGRALASPSTGEFFRRTHVRQYYWLYP